MSGPNHVIGGIVFTGLYLSMWDNNIYAKPQFLFFTAFFSLLPDIDHTKSLIGKPFYPIAVYLDKKFGHRTITHSLLCYFTLAIVIGMIETVYNNSFAPNTESKGMITKIFLWSYASHLIFDMLTIQGIPLLYPFRKNPCVIPGNPKYRLRSLDFRSESVVFVIFVMLAFTCKDLFANGFWNSYDKAFGTVKHIRNEIRMSKTLVLVKYHYSSNFQEVKGEGYAVSATSNSFTMITKDSFATVDEMTRIISLIPIRTQKSISIIDFNFQNITPDSLLRIVSGKPIIKLSVISNIPISYSKQNVLTTSNQVQLSEVINPRLLFVDADSLTRNIQNQIQLTELNISKNKLELFLYENHKQKVLDKISAIRKNLESESLAEREKAIRELPAAKTDSEAIQPHFDQRKILNTQLEYLKKSLSIARTKNVSGFISYYLIK